MRHRKGSDVYLCTFFNLGARVGWMVNTTPRLLYPRERVPVPIEQGAGWSPGSVWPGAENVAPTGIRYTDYAILGHRRPDSFLYLYRKVMFVKMYFHSSREKRKLQKYSKHLTSGLTWRLEWITELNVSDRCQWILSCKTKGCKMS
jgi:hypothetical protein